MTPQIISSALSLMSCSLYHQLQCLQPSLDPYQEFSVQSHSEGIVTTLSWEKSSLDAKTFNMMLKISHHDPIGGGNRLFSDFHARISSFTLDDKDQFHLTILEDKEDIKNKIIQEISDIDDYKGRILIDNCRQFSHNILNCIHLMFDITFVVETAHTKPSIDHHHLKC